MNQFEDDGFIVVDDEGHYLSRWDGNDETGADINDIVDTPYVFVDKEEIDWIVCCLDREIEEQEERRKDPRRKQYFDDSHLTKMIRFKSRMKIKKVKITTTILDD